MSRRVAIGLIRLYQASFCGTFGNRCRFYPSCSEYAAEAVGTHGVIRGFALAIRRIVRCAPWARGGIDLPPASERG